MKQIGTKEEGDLEWLLNALRKYQEELFKLNNELKEFSFNWEEATKEYVEMRNETVLYDWLYPIRFNITQAFILEILQEVMITNRERDFKLVCIKFNMNLEAFYRVIEELKVLFIEYGKVKICQDGKVIIMNDV